MSVVIPKRDKIAQVSLKNGVGIPYVANRVTPVLTYVNSVSPTFTLFVRIDKGPYFLSVRYFCAG